ncbi:hypothetical protein PF003_g21930 [Phytophthora fragariae]|nr:hypothetical protein PF003_g21930 [Phytophthora fragariae]
MCLEVVAHSICLLLSYVNSNCPPSHSVRHLLIPRTRSSRSLCLMHSLQPLVDTPLQFLNAHNHEIVAYKIKITFLVKINLSCHELLACLEKKTCQVKNNLPGQKQSVRSRITCPLKNNVPGQELLARLKTNCQVKNYLPA